MARRSDMDMNGHINNVTYLGWALETVPPHIADSSTLIQVQSTGPPLTCWARQGCSPGLCGCPRCVVGTGLHPQCWMYGACNDAGWTHGAVVPVCCRCR